MEPDLDDDSIPIDVCEPMSDMFEPMSEAVEPVESDRDWVVSFNDELSAASASRGGGPQPSETAYGRLEIPEPISDVHSTPSVRVQLIPDLLGEGMGAALPFIEVRTKNTAYGFDSSLTCTSVHDLRGDHPVFRHPMLGATLLGGVSRRGDGLDRSGPLPVPGMLAVLRRRGRRGSAFARTSRVHDVCLFVYVKGAIADELPTVVGEPEWPIASGDFG